MRVVTITRAYASYLNIQPCSAVLFLGLHCSTMVSEQVKRKILRLWQDPKTGLSGIVRFQQKLEAHGISVSIEDVKKLLSPHPSYHLFSRTIRPTKWNTITETGVGHGMQMDLMDMKKIATRNKNFSWILCIIDVYSRHAWAFPLKRKTQTQVHGALKAWLESLGPKKPYRITSDAGTEFLGRRVEALLQSHQIKHYVNQTGDKTTTGIVERFNRTLRELMGRNFTRLAKLQWIEDLPKLLENYNASRHSTLGESPSDVWGGRAVPKARPVVREQFPFRSGDQVRVLLPTRIFDKKAGSEKWSSAVYKIIRREGFKYALSHANGREVNTR